MNSAASIKLIAMDLDDTLLDSRLSLSTRSITTIRKAREVGLLMTLATNRGFLAAKPFIEPLGISGLIITYGGAQTRNAENGQIIHEVLIERELAAEVMRFADKHGVYMHIQRNDDILYRKGCEWSEKYEAYVGYHGTEAPWLNQEPMEASKTMILGEPERIAVLLPLAQEAFHGRLRVTSSKPWFMELNHSAASKGSALKALAGILGLESANIAAFGDHPMVDRDMLEYAALGVAMGNAPEELKAVADLVAPTNDDDGVAVVIEEIMRQQGLWPAP
jgi:Cof subfamily protein (haloacid dehalogenase superfamily)